MASGQDVYNGSGYSLGQFTDPYDSNNTGDWLGTSAPGGWSSGGVIGSIAKAITGYDSAAASNEKKERAAIQSARAWEEYLDATKYQRAVKDLEAAGLNPWLAVQNGSLGGGSSSSTSTGGTSAQNSSKSNLTGIAALIAALAKLLA